MRVTENSTLHYDVLPKNLKFIRKFLELTQKEFAALIGIHENTYVNWEKPSSINLTFKEREIKLHAFAILGKDMYLSHILRIAVICRVSIDTLVKVDMSMLDRGMSIDPELLGLYDVHFALRTQKK